MNALMLAVGLLLLWWGGEGLVRGASAFGRRLGLSPLVVGLTIVSVGTSSPELAAALAGVLQGVPAVSFGNIVGSNIANLGLVLGVTAIIWPLNVEARFLRREMPFMLVTSGLVAALIFDGLVNRIEGLVLLSLLALYLWVLLRPTSKLTEETAEVNAQFEEAFGEPRQSIALSGLLVVGGIAALIVGAHFLIESAVSIARTLGITERVIGLTIVALGTSLPELASSMVAAFRREGDIVLGNLIGSNIFNILFILGTTAAVKPLPVNAAASWSDLIVMLGISFLVWFFLATGTRLSRLEGALLAALYALYLGFLFR